MESKPAPVELISEETSLAFRRLSRPSGFAQSQNLSTTLNVDRIQAALRSAERGQTWQLFTVYRDMVSGFSHLQAEWSKRKGVIVGQTQALIPHDKNNEDDKVACEVIRQMIENCRNWYDAMIHLLDATLYPLAVVEKIFEPVNLSEKQGMKHPLRLKLKELAPVDPIVLCFQIPYLPNGNKNPVMNYNPDDWESWLRFYSTMPTGNIDWSPSDVYAPDPSVHIVHRSVLMSPTIPPNFGGQMRCILFWWLLATQDRDWWGQMMNKYGMPLIIGKADVSQADTVGFLRQAFQLATQVGGLVIPKDAEVILEQMNATDGSNAHKIFSDFCNCEVSKTVVGQVLSSTPKNTGLGSGMAAQAEEVREDIRNYDTTRMADTLKRQLFEPFLRINGYRGRAPNIFWGGMRSDGVKMIAQAQALFAQGGMRATENGVQTISDRIGIEMEQLEHFDEAPPSKSNADVNK